MERPVHSLTVSVSFNFCKTVTKPMTNASGDSAASENEVEKEMETEVAEGTRDYPQYDMEHPQVEEEVETEEAEGTRHYPRYKMEDPIKQHWRCLLIFLNFCIMHLDHHACHLAGSV